MGKSITNSFSFLIGGNIQTKKEAVCKLYKRK